MNEKEVAYVEDVVNELSDMIDKSFKTIIDNKQFVMPDFESVISKRTLDLEQIDFLQNVFTEPFAELHRIEEDEEIAKKYSWLTEEKRKKLIEVLDALVSSLISEYTEQQPEFQELKENFRKIAENEKEEAQQEK
jgi:hypothetical protein